MSNEQLAISNDPQTRQMKDSGVECIGEIPESWEIRRNKELFYEVNDRCSADTELPLLSVSEYHGVTPKVENSGILTRAESLEGYKICKENDIVMNIMLAWKRAQAVSKYQGIVSPAYCVYRNKSNGLMNMDYVHYLIRSDLYIGIFKMYSTGIIDSRLRLYPDKFLSLYSHVPPADVQQTIAAYLDRKCTQIDTLIANQQQQIEKLKAYKQSVITETVTKGLDPDVAMKDSGVEWIDCIPETWKMVRGKGVFNETDSRSTDGKEELLTVSQYTGITPRSEKNVNMFEAKTLEGYKICETGDIAANTMWMWAGAIGVSNYSGVISPSYNVYRQIHDTYDASYLDYLLRIAPLVQCYESMSTGIRASRLRLYPHQFLSISFPAPPMEEQKQIVSYLKEKCDRVEKLIRIKQQKIEKLQQYKKSLIYEYVTGKREVELCCQP